MNVIYFLIPIAIILVVIAVVIFFWAVRSDQFKDLERHGHSILFDDDVKHKSSVAGKHSVTDEPKAASKENAPQ